MELNEAIRTKAYNKKLEDMSMEELITILCTDDGKGKRFKLDAVMRLLEIQTNTILDKLGLDHEQI